MRESRPGPAPAKTQQTGKTYRVGLIFSTSPVSEMTGPEPVHPLAKAFLQRLRTLGYILLSPITRMGTSVQDGWRESSRPELWAVCGLQRPTTDDCPTRASSRSSHLRPLSKSPHQRCSWKKPARIGFVWQQHCDANLKPVR